MPTPTRIKLDNIDANRAKRFYRHWMQYHEADLIEKEDVPLIRELISEVAEKFETDIETICVVGLSESI